MLHHAEVPSRAAVLGVSLIPAVESFLWNAFHHWSNYPDETRMLRHSDVPALAAALGVASIPAEEAVEVGGLDRECCSYSIDTTRTLHHIEGACPDAVLGALLIPVGEAVQWHRFHRTSHAHGPGHSVAAVLGPFTSTAHQGEASQSHGYHWTCWWHLVHPAKMLHLAGVPSLAAIAALEQAA